MFSSQPIQACLLFRKIIEFSNRSRNGIAVDDIIMNASALHDQVLGTVPYGRLVKLIQWN
jgi:hypothetical protein